MKYILEIYHGKNPDALAVFASDSPFLPIARGDTINPFSWSDIGGDLDVIREKFGARCVFRVTDISHFLHNSDGDLAKHQLCVFTEVLDG